MVSELRKTIGGSGYRCRYAERLSQLLEGIDDIDWHCVSHAYGPADDVPYLLRSLCSSNEKICDDAIGKLFGNIWHQGTVYEATIYAIPFLIELLKSKETRNRSAIACLLACIVNGYGYLEAHTTSTFFTTVWKGILHKEGKTLEAEMAEELRITSHVRNAAKRSIPFITPYLADPNPETREKVALALSCVPELAEINIPLLASAIRQETDAEVREAMQRAIDRLSRTENA